MTKENFIYWLQGVFEGQSSLTPEQQVKMIKDHLQLVLTKVTPPIVMPQATTADLNNIHTAFTTDQKQPLECTTQNTIAIRRLNPNGAIC